MEEPNREAEVSLLLEVCLPALELAKAMTASSASSSASSSSDSDSAFFVFLPREEEGGGVLVRCFFLVDDFFGFGVAFFLVDDFFGFGVAFFLEVFAFFVVFLTGVLVRDDFFFLVEDFLLLFSYSVR